MAWWTRSGRRTRQPRKNEQQINNKSIKKKSAAKKPAAKKPAAKKHILTSSKKRKHLDDGLVDKVRPKNSAAKKK